LAGFDAKGWHTAGVPPPWWARWSRQDLSHVNYATNLKALPGMNYSDKQLFANQEIATGVRFGARGGIAREFTLSEERRRKRSG